MAIDDFMVTRNGGLNTRNGSPLTQAPWVENRIVSPDTIPLVMIMLVAAWGISGTPPVESPLLKNSNEPDKGL
jgi:hypothetical protein